ncbi:MAG: 4Fe-4S dicluster domain-containing protein [Clostridia bacterium]|nr:4Fe-4S dicluster domain-containing protein [Clostridia bacterium]
MIELFREKKDCCGCTACKNSCPNHAISMRNDEEGFQYPSIETALCIECGLCKSACPFIDEYIIKGNLSVPDVYAVKHVSDDVRMSSSSGGAFTALSDYILNNQGIVFGAAFDKDFDVFHKAVSTKDDRNDLRGSKYAQSDLKESFKEVKKALAADQYVLFSGTPCQNAGLYNFLGEKVNKEKLFFCDLVCHGVPSPKIFCSYKNLLKRKYHSDISGINFRYKPLGWRSQTICVLFESGAKYCKSALEDVYYRLFLSDIILRPSCYNCKYTNFQRPSDITIADFWDIRKHIPQFADDCGISLVLINSEKGRKLFDNAKNHLEYRASSMTDCMQPNLQAPCKMPPIRGEFWRDYFKNGFKHAIKKYAGYGMVASIKKIVKIFIKNLKIDSIIEKFKNR